MKSKLILVSVTLSLLIAPRIFAADGEQGDDNPTGVSGIYNGQITTAGNYDPYTGNAMRVIDDIAVPGSLGAYPLKWTRYFNSHVTYHDNGLGGSWRFSYLDYKHGYVYHFCTPDGRRISTPSASTPLDQYGVEEFVDEAYPTRTLHLADGGKVIAALTGSTYYPTQIIDPYGLITTISWVQVGSVRRLDKVTEPGGRTLSRDMYNRTYLSLGVSVGVGSPLGACRQHLLLSGRAWIDLTCGECERRAARVLQIRSVWETDVLELNVSTTHLPNLRSCRSWQRRRAVDFRFGSVR